MFLVQEYLTNIVKKKRPYRSFAHIAYITNISRQKWKVAFIMSKCVTRPLRNSMRFWHSWRSGYNTTHHLLNKSDLERQERLVLKGRIVVEKYTSTWSAQITVWLLLQTPQLWNAKSDVKVLSSLLFTKIVELSILLPEEKSCGVWRSRTKPTSVQTVKTGVHLQVLLKTQSELHTGHLLRREKYDFIFCMQTKEKQPGQLKRNKAHLSKMSRSYFNPKERKEKCKPFIKINLVSIK